MKEALDKLINRLVLRKYPIVKDCEINMNTLKLGLRNPKKGSPERYSFKYYITPNEYGEFPYDNEFKEIEELTENLFKMLGPKSYQQIGNVEFFKYED